MRNTSLSITRRYRNVLGKLSQWFGDLSHCNCRECRECRELKSVVEQVLNTIHCDNGHFTNTRGLEKSCDEARRIVMEYQKQLGLDRHD
jgi:NADH:ubiquinone oxidoreductase subunit F (NADH-binding)